MTNNKKVELDKFHEIEIQKIFDGTLALQNLRLQASTLFGTANIAALGVAINSQKAGIFLFAAVLLWAAMFIDVVIMSFLARFYYRGFILQEKFAPKSESTFLLIFAGERENQIREIAKITDERKRIKAIRWLNRATIAGFWLPLAASLVELTAGLILWLYVRWSIF
jgi:hypothetical protein